MNRIERDLDCMGFAFYRLPDEDTYVRIEQHGMPEVLKDIRELGDRQGFVFAPFMASEQDPIVMIRPDVVQRHTSLYDSSYWNNTWEVESEAECRSRYARSFALFHDAVARDGYGKLVLSRTVCLHGTTLLSDIFQLFERACRRYPRMAVILVSTPQTGVWLMATPEPLVLSDGTIMRTVALAGTMPADSGEWSEKNKREQQIVAHYIDSRLRSIGIQPQQEGPTTLHAAHLAHLCTTFSFRSSDGMNVGDVAAVLHPTPAICGMPQEEARQFIADHEGHQRHYYSGYAGPVGIDGDTALYVSLRCMNIGFDDTVLYAGGGIMPDSTEEEEWNETEIKMMTMMRLLTTSEF